jgi:hypothetical protein
VIKSSSRRKVSRGGGTGRGINFDKISSMAMDTYSAPTSLSSGSGEFPGLPRREGEDVAVGKGKNKKKGVPLFKIGLR